MEKILLEGRRNLIGEKKEAYFLGFSPFSGCPSVLSLLLGTDVYPQLFFSRSAIDKIDKIDKPSLPVFSLDHPLEGI